MGLGDAARYPPEVAVIRIMETTVATLEPASSCGFRPLPLSVLRHTAGIKIDVFQQVAGETSPTLLASRDLVLTPAQLDDLQAQGCDSLLVRDHEYVGITQHLQRNLAKLLRCEQQPAGERYALLQTAMALEIEQALRGNNAQAMVDVATEIGRDIATFLSDNPMSPAEMFAMVRHDTVTFVHVTNVAGYLVLLAKSLGVGQQDHLAELAIGAMLHDFGKQMLPRALLTKAGRLSDEERLLMERHPQLGYEALVGRKGVTAMQLMMVYQHHERLDGSGYPVAILGDEIQHSTQMLAIVDVFDALTADRPYRKRISPDQALAFLTQEAEQNRLNKDYIECWASIFQPR